jgi:hypothetical protein
MSDYSHGCRHDPRREPGRDEPCRHACAGCATRDAHVDALRALLAAQEARAQRVESAARAMLAKHREFIGECPDGKCDCTAHELEAVLSQPADEHKPGCYYLRSSDQDGDEAARCDCAKAEPSADYMDGYAQGHSDAVMEQAARTMAATDKVLAEADALLASMPAQPAATGEGTPGVPTVDECERIAFKAGVEAALRWSWPDTDDAGIADMILMIAPANHTAVIPNAPCSRCGGSGLVMDGTVNPVACPGCAK